MPPKTKILVAGATGKQGGAVARLLLEHGHAVRALTRKPEGAGAKALADKGAEVVTGDLTDRASLDAALKGTEGAFLVCTPFGGGPAAETRQGATAADAVKAAGVFLVYSSVANADRRTGIPHFDSKYEVEKHIRSIGLQATILAPVYFMENLYFGKDQLKNGVYAVPVPPARKLAQITVQDIAAAAVAAFEDRGRHAGKRYDLAGDEQTGEETVRIFSAAAGRTFKYVQVPVEVIRQKMGDDSARMYEWFDKTGYSFDQALLAREFPGVRWTSLETWAKTVPWSSLLA